MTRNGNVRRRSVTASRLNAVAPAIAFAMGIAWLGLVPPELRASSATDPIVATAQTPPSAPGEAIVLRWKAQKEKGVYGYIIYRSEQREGPFLRVSKKIVRVPEGHAEGEINAYHFTDTTTQGAVTYYYYLDLVSRTGRKQRFSGVIRKKAEPAQAPANPDKGAQDVPDH